jgi:DNA-binding NtrC family response regulator
MMMSDVLVVSPERSVINAAVSALAGQPLFITGVQSYRDAMYVLVKKHIAVLLCDENLPDGSWKDLLGQIAMMAEPPRLVVVAATTDRAVCAEAINLGCHDVLAKPVDETEIMEVVLRAVPTTHVTQLQHT